MNDGCGGCAECYYSAKFYERARSLVIEKRHSVMPSIMENDGNLTVVDLNYDEKYDELAFSCCELIPVSAYFAPEVLISCCEINTTIFIDIYEGEKLVFYMEISADDLCLCQHK
jgi:hypothetical protein